MEKVKTKYVIKVRGDEYYSNVQYILNSIRVQPDKVHTSSIFFRAWQYAEYHISDHIIAGTTENILIMFMSHNMLFKIIVEIDSLHTMSF